MFWKKLHCLFDIFHIMLFVGWFGFLIFFFIRYGDYRLPAVLLGIFSVFLGATFTNWLLGFIHDFLDEMAFKSIGHSFLL